MEEYFSAPHVCIEALRHIEIIQNFNFENSIDFSLLRSAFVDDLKTFSLTFLDTFAANFDAIF